MTISCFIQVLWNLVLITRKLNEKSIKMSHAFYKKLYNETDKLLGLTLENDISLQKAKKKIKNPTTAHCTVFTLYLKYITLIKNLDQCYDQIVQPQKRPLLRRLLDMCIGKSLTTSKFMFLSVNYCKKL